MTDIKQGQKAPDFTMPTDSKGSITLSKLQGGKIILYFYPKDDTPGCTKEACGFNEALLAFKALNTQVIGVSKCSVAKHDKFKTKYGLNFTLASDEDGKVCEAYGTWVEKSMYGKKYMGIERATFLIDEQGKIAALWRNVKVPGHVDEVKAAIESLKKAA
jgi:peroxiredoxin Q/BCP